MNHFSTKIAVSLKKSLSFSSNMDRLCSVPEVFYLVINFAPSFKFACWNSPNFSSTRQFVLILRLKKKRRPKFLQKLKCEDFKMWQRSVQFSILEDGSSWSCWPFDGFELRGGSLPSVSGLVPFGEILRFDQVSM